MGQGHSEEDDSDLEEEVGVVHREVGKSSLASNAPVVASNPTSSAASNTSLSELAITSPPSTEISSSTTIMTDTTPIASTSSIARTAGPVATSSQISPATISSAFLSSSTSPTAVTTIASTTPTATITSTPTLTVTTTPTSTTTTATSTSIASTTAILSNTATTTAIADTSATTFSTTSSSAISSPTLSNTSDITPLASSTIHSLPSQPSPEPVSPIAVLHLPLSSPSTAAATIYSSSLSSSPSVSSSSELAFSTANPSLSSYYSTSSIPSPSASSLVPLSPVSSLSECPVCRLEGNFKQFHKIEFCPTLTELKKKRGSGGQQIHPGPWYHSFHQHPLMLREKGSVMKIVDGVNCDHCGKGCSQTQYHCCNGCNFDLCPSCVADEIGPNGPFDPEFSRSFLKRLAEKEYKLEYDQFREFLSNVDSEVKAWSRSPSQDVRDLAIVPRDTASGDLNPNRQVLIYQISTKRLFPRMSFEEAAREPSVDAVALGRLNGFQDFGAWSQKGDFIYMVWSREAVIDEFLPGPGLMSMNTATSVWNAIRPF